jgi:uncharacterized protein
MKDGLRFVDCDIHVMEPPSVWKDYLDPRFKDRLTFRVNKEGDIQALVSIDGIPLNANAEMSQYRKPLKPKSAQSSANRGQSTPGGGTSRIQSTGRMDFAIQRNYNPEAQVMAYEMEGIDIAVTFPTQGLVWLGRNDLDPLLSLAICQAYNDWIYDYCQFSPDLLKWVAMLPIHDVNIACQELIRCVKKGAVGSFIRPNLVNGHYWHSNYWDPLYSLHEELDVAWCFHEGTGVQYSYMNVLYGENPFYRHVASHWIEMQQALVAQIVGGVFEFHPSLRVGYLEAQNSWVPGLLTRIENDYPNYRDNYASYLSMSPKEYFLRNCWAAVEGSEPEIPATASLIDPSHMCISTDYPHFDSNFPNVSSNLLETAGRDVAAKIFEGGARLYNFSEEHYARADAAMTVFRSARAATGEVSVS